MNECTIILLGATGDLAKRKLIPAIYSLVAAGKLKKFLLIGAAREKTTASDMIDQAIPFIQNSTAQFIAELKEKSAYQQLDFNQEGGFVQLHTLEFRPRN